MKKAYIFPGQGSQFPGMGKSLYERSEKARDLMEQANGVLGFRLTDIMFEGTAEDLKETRVTQPAVFLHSYVLAACLDGFAPDMVAGHSLGEFSALAAAGSIRFEDALRLVAIRANAMQRCCEEVPGSMAAIIGLPDDAVEMICSGCGGIVLPANFNSDGQVVISGETEAVNEACQAAREAGAKRAIPLMVSGAFHSPMMEPARLELAEAIQATALAVPSCPVYQNVSARAETNPVRIKKNLLKQLTSPVRWTQSVRRMIADGAGYFMEIGPGTVLQTLVRRTGGPDIIVEGLSE